MKKFSCMLFSILLLFAALCGCNANTPTDTPPEISGVLFEDATVTYDGTEHSITASDLPENVTARYDNNTGKDAGTYAATAQLYFGTKLLDTLTATLTIQKRQATVYIDDATVNVGSAMQPTYRVEGAVEGDDLGITLSAQTSDSGIGQITGKYANPNYLLGFSGGKLTVIGTLFDSSALPNYTAPFLPSFAPFALYDTTLFSETIITSISFPFAELAAGYTVQSQNLYMPIYVVKSDFSTKQADCTVENGKKILLDFTGKLDGVSAGDWLTADDLHITVGANETLAFGDEQMAVLPQFRRDDSTYGFWNKIFGSKGNNNHSLVFKILGYKTKSKPSPPSESSTYISFLGDSISTYAGYSNGFSYNSTIASNAVWFPNSSYAGGNLTVEETWWHKSLTALDYKLCVNNSWSGSAVFDVQTYNVRANNLHNKAKVKPDVIVVFMGVNDYAAGVPLGDYDGSAAAPITPTCFTEAYGKTIANMKAAYPDADIYCCTFLPDRKRFGGDTNGAGISETAYNDAIRDIAENMHVNLIDLYNDCGITAQNINSYTVDRLHPNAAGMQKIADTVVSAILANSLAAAA